MDKNRYGIEFLIFDCMAGPMAFFYDSFHMIYYRKYAFFGFLLRFFKVFTMEKIRFFKENF